MGYPEAIDVNKMTVKQAYILRHIDRVEELPYKLRVRTPQRRYQLDGWECTPQITGLVVRNRVVEYPDGTVARVAS